MAVARTGDKIDEILEQWHRERPDIDASAKAITARIVRLNSLIQRLFGEAFNEIGLTDPVYSVIVALRRSGHPFVLTPSGLSRQLMVSSGGLTAMIDRAESAGLVERRPNPDDRRGVLVALTNRGRELVDEAMSRQAALEHTLVAQLSERDREALSRLLRKLLISIEAREDAG